MYRLQFETACSEGIIRSSALPSVGSPLCLLHFAFFKIHKSIKQPRCNWEGCARQFLILLTPDCFDCNTFAINLQVSTAIIGDFFELWMAWTRFLFADRDPAY